MSYAALPVLRTPRLTLRPLETDDADALAEGAGNYDVSRWLGSVPYPYGRDDAERFIARLRGDNRMVWAICDADGLCGVGGVEEEFGYWIARPAWRRGYGFEAAHAIAGHWFADPARGDLVTGYFSDNRRSAAILKALGFVVTDTGLRFARSLSQDLPTTHVRLSRARWRSRQGFRLTTSRLTLRPLARSDARALAAMSVEPVARNMSTLPVGMSVAQAEHWIAEGAFRGLPGFRLGIERDDRLAGVVGFGGAPLSIAYFLAPEHWGRGLATEALAAFLPALFDRFPVTRIAAERFADNPASGAVLRKFGFEETGRSFETSKARLEPAPAITYAVHRDNLRTPQ